ncbi:hypothetical protein FA13DRAFT_825901 [Coprinellus micaceus]|uniref:F-box domain-containing protein n=1 Tax=Coprinellus micaceus TaxID=71717 RepID=A0A4Y7T1I6_COPMI|nr:hypothetical protein FA13DRAFT_825901 [Coprinellus micaceus]
MTMPLDVVYEILSQLALIDLINVARVNRSWRKTLLGTQAGMVWKTAREAGKYPEPPEDFTEQRWARFLLCKVCQYCGSKLGWQSPDWLLLRRVCAACRRTHLVDVRCITERRFPNVDKDIVKRRLGLSSMRPILLGRRYPPHFSRVGRNPRS